MIALKHGIGRMTSVLNPQCQYDRALFIIGHMRCGSTALSNILCSREDVSGYGEAHIAYVDEAALGILAMNQMKRNAWKMSATHLFDKILHNRYDDQLYTGFSTARAIFMVRSPDDTIRSIRALFSRIGSDEYASDAMAADYYAQRLEQMLVLWNRFARDRRISVSHVALTTNPERELARISDVFGFTPPLVNRYLRPSEVAGRGAGDPLSSHKFDRIVASNESSSLINIAEPLDLPDGRNAQLQSLYARCLSIFEIR
jgi:Sulfotransferase family